MANPRCPLCIAGEHRTAQEHNAWCDQRVADIRQRYPVVADMPMSVFRRLGRLSPRRTRR